MEGRPGLALAAEQSRDGKGVEGESTAVTRAQVVAGELDQGGKKGSECICLTEDGVPEFSSGWNWI